MAGIGAGHEDSADCVSRAMHESALALLKETWILVKQRWKHRASHVVFNGAVGESCAQTLSIPFSALSITGFTIFGLADPRKRSIPGDLDVIERAASYNLELLRGC